MYSVIDGVYINKMCRFLTKASYLLVVSFTFMDGVSCFVTLYSRSYAI